MKILVSGVCGFVGSTLARALLQSGRGHQVIGFDNFIRPGSETNRAELKALGVKLFHGDLRAASDLETLPACDWVIDAAANPSVLAGVDGRTSSRQLIEHNLGGTVNMLEYCKQHRAGFILLSTSRVYAIAPLAALAVEAVDGAFRPARGAALPPGLTAAGLDETFATLAPVSLYGATKLASEALALEYGETFQLPVFINRCGVLAGAGQFGRPDQGIFAYWLNSHLRRRPLKYIGFGGLGHQVRDCLHPRDLVPVLEVDCLLPLNNINSRFHGILRQFAPFGPGNMAPLFMTKGVMDAGGTRIVGKNHLKLSVVHPDVAGGPFSAIAFQQGERFGLIEKQIPFNICYHIEENEWNGSVNLQLNIKDIKFSD